MLELRASPLRPRVGGGTMCAALFVCGALLAGCGIPRVGFVAAPPLDSVELQDALSSPRIEFDHNSELNDTDDFSGYVLYYRLYDRAASDTDYVEDEEFILNEPVQPGTDRLESRDYRRVVAANESAVDAQTPPLLLVPPRLKGDSFTVRLSFQPGSQANPEEANATYPSDGTPSPIQIPLARSVEEPGSQQPKGFLLGDYNTATDKDLSRFEDIAGVIDSNELFVALYVLGFGIDGLTFQALYSRPVSLGYFKLQPAQ